MSKVENVIRQLQNQLERDLLIDVGVGAANRLEVSQSTFRKALLQMVTQGYSIYYFMASKKLGGPKVIIKVLAKSSTPWVEGFTHLNEVKMIEII